MADDVTITVRVRDATTSGITAVNRSMDRLVSATQGMDKSFGSAVGAAMSLAPALLPMAASVAPIAAGLGAATIAVGAFGAAIGPQVAAMSEASKAEEEYTKAVKEHGKSSSEAAKAEAAYLAAVKELPPATRTAAASLSVLKDEYKTWSNALADDTMPVATKSFAVFGALFPKLTPMVKGASGQLDRFMTIAAGGIQSRGFDSFMTKFSDFATKSMSRAIDGMVRLTTTMDTGAVGGGISEFMQYARDNGPMVGDTLKNIGQALTRLLIAASDVGVGMLTVVNAFAKLVASVPVDLITTLLQVAIAFKAVRLAAAGLAVVGPVLAAATLHATAFARAAMFGGVGAAVTGVAQRMTLLQKASIGLGILAVAALGINKLAENARGAPPDVDRLTASLKNLATTGKMTGELKKTFGDFDGLIDKMKKLSVESDKAAEAAEGAFGFRIPVLDDIAGWFGDAANDMAKGSESLNALKDDFKGVDEALSGLVSSGSPQEAAAGFDLIKKAGLEAGYSTKEINALLPEYLSSLQNMAAEQRLTAAGMGLFGEQALAAKTKLDAQKQSSDGLRQSINALSDAYLMARGGVRGMEAAIDAATAAAKQNGKTLDENTEKGRGNNQALDDLASATMRAAEAARDNGASWSHVNGIYDRGKQKLIEVATQMTGNREAAKKLADQILRTPNKTARLKGNMEDLQKKLTSAKSQLKRVPDSRKAKVRADIAALQAAIRRAKAALASVRDKTVTVRTNYVVSGGSARRPGTAGSQLQFAHGGIVGAAGGGPRSRMTLVGEQGPELIDLAPGSRVHSNPDSRRMAAGWGGQGGAQVGIEFRSSGRRADDLLLEILREAIDARGGDPVKVLTTRRRGR